MPRGATLPSAPAAACEFDVGRYDRLRVLRTELERVVRDGGRARVRSADRPELGGPALERALRTV